ncbi:Threonine-phosphate decarboxylase [Corynebacterium ciconiae DSM 44920]|uniref:aminotransferase class I/II-fold pyridoxal phosphate-dependent enzyme n=1 Tax=Corynebacterium ciconiae TaxID=227319 RepID=UPI0003775978|nr:aminotransferase class I/II-fold pyridoxal phosphate-dependent enzyme [Corynebacterium ciconiae]WKD60706.1 Threonine-phosphate decarboxylase [Corynebacterium ciconiae DSM 44920]
MSLYDLHYHGDVSAAAAELDFAVNVAARTPEWLRAALHAELDNLRDYPDHGLAAAARQAIAEMHGVPAENVLLLAGAAEGFALLGRLEPRHPVAITPSFTEPAAQLLDQGYQVQLCYTGDDFALPSPPPEADMVVLGNPTNPTGRLYSASDIAAVSAPHRTVVVDEAFMDIVGEQYSQIPSAAAGRYVVLRSLTKTFAVAGLRCGYAVASTEVLEQWARYRPPWPLGTLQYRAFLSIAEHGASFLRHHRQWLAEAKQRQCALLAPHATIHLPDSPAPFMLIEPHCAHPERVRRVMAQAGVSVRPCHSFPGLDERYWRLAVREEASVRRLIDAYLHAIAATTE